MLLAVLLVLGWVVAQGLSAGAEEPRDPFTFGPRTGERAGAPPVLMGILWDATHPLAMVGERAVTVGETVAEWRVTAIHQDGLVIERGTQREVVHPGEAFPP